MTLSEKLNYIWLRCKTGVSKAFMSGYVRNEQGDAAWTPNLVKSWVISFAIHRSNLSKGSALESHYSASRNYYMWRVIMWLVTIDKL